MSTDIAIDFTRGVPAPESFPIEEVIAASQAVLERYGTTILQYGKAHGFLPLREWLAEWQGVHVDQVMTANGTLQSIEFLCFHFLQPGDVVFTELPTYDRTITMLRRHHAQVVGIPIGPDGPDIDELEKALTRHTPKFFYIIPDFQNPAGATCSLAKREKLVELAQKHGFWLVEDGPYRPLRFRGEPQPSLFELCPESVIHLFSFTKLIGPGLRAGVVFGPVPLIDKLAKIAEDTYITPGLVAQGIVYEFCEAGHLPGQIEKLKALYSPRLQACLDALNLHLPDAQTTRPNGGFFLSVILPAGISAVQVRDQAKKYNLNLADGRGFFPDGSGERFLRLPYCALTPEQIYEGVGRLAMAVKEVVAAR